MLAIYTVFERILIFKNHGTTSLFYIIHNSQDGGAVLERVRIYLPDQMESHPKLLYS
jgi:hypothetical protein